jgi:uncharacterized protein HemY
MIKFLILCVVFFLLYIGFSAIGEYDSGIKFSVYDYQIETTLFVFMTVFVFTQLFLMVVLKLIFLIFDLPTILKKRWYRRKLQKINSRLMNVLAELLMGNKKKSLKITSNILSELDGENKDFVNLVRAEEEDSFDKKIQYYRNLIDKKNFSVYASKKLAEIFYNNTHHTQAEEFALKAFNEDDTDTELMLILIRIYASLGSWPKMVFIVSKLQRADRSLFELNSEEIASYYYSASKHYLQLGSEDEAKKYLESALEYKPDYIEALNLLMELLTNSNNSAAILKVLRSAFLAKPCFEIARMFADSSRSSAEAIYGTLAGIVQPVKYPAVFLALAGYLGIKEKVIEIKEQKLISHDSVSK